MPRISRVQIDKDEKRILIELQKNSKFSIETISKHCGFSRQKVWRLIKRLEENRLIWGYTAIIDEKKNDLNHYTLLIKRTMKQLEEKTVHIIVSRKLEDIVSEIGVTVESSYYVNGDYDWVLTFTAQNIMQAKKCCELLFSLHPSMIEKITLLETLFIIKNHHIINPEPKMLEQFI